MSGNNEEILEITHLTELATALGDGMVSLKPANIAGPVRSYAQEIPAEFIYVESFVDSFIDWKLSTKMPKEKRVLWSHPDAVPDITKFVVRKVWAIKVKEGSIINPVARMLATSAEINKGVRTKMHEAINHAAKHNADIKALGKDIHDRVDLTVKETLNDSMKHLASVALVELPSLQQALQQALEDKTND